MMVKVNAGSLAAQASSVSTVVASRVTALNSAKQSLTSFANQAGLEGTAYQNAKSYATGVLGTLIDGMILLSEETEEGVSKLQSLYSDKCGGESLDSDVLTKKIEKDEELLAKIHDLQAHLDKHATFLSHAFDGLEATIKARLKKNKKKLKYLMEFNAESSTVFDGLTEVQDAVSAGLNYVSEGFGNFNGTFDTSGKGLDWTKTIKTGMEKRRDKVSIDKNSLLKEVKKAYKAGKINKQTYQSIKSGLVNSSTAFLKELAKAKLTDKAVETFTKESWEALSKNFQTMQFSGVLAAVNGADHHLPNTQILTKLAKRAIDTGKVSVATDKSEIECDHKNCPLSSAIVIPLHIHDVIVGTLKLYFSDAQHMTYVDRQLAEGLGNIFSTQLALGQAEEATRLLQDAEMKSLQAQVNPHFLFNALNTIYGLIRMDSEKARKLVQDFSKVIRANLQRAKQNLIPLHDELEQVNAYLALEEARFPNMVAFNLDNQTNSDDNLMIPPFTLQVLIENSYKHAFKHINKNNQLKVTIARNNDRLHIIVQDNGIGIPKEKLITLGKKTQISKKGSGTAIENLVRRLNIIYDGQASLKFESNDLGTCAIVNIPIKN